MSDPRTPDRSAPTSDSARRCARALIELADEAQSLGMRHAARALATAALARVAAAPRTTSDDLAFAALLTRARRAHGVDVDTLADAAE
ncbi:hypothetical protein [Sandaracinus amylolyticus]|uniref:hypothetical protein n=1 Tax=Sandaracinus amylolyticus TaxID=927083 RepID=UPI001F1B3CC5|nr:hypothetical protein [Sandaracinus amylolyticus]UJR85730.1 Hypothetical protein I5071_78100 [Sandaracinus amylolyticus]